ncbi:alpha/beta hydrolase [Candidatus Gottesmanbacteria bacterium]|nr:alpha/beta hydrolase [Candidatus Gottesmanbacteria bacterium]
MKNMQLVQIPTEDGLTLPGLLYESANSKKAAIYLHGNGSSSVFYSDDVKDIQAKALNNKGISYLVFNNRGAHYIKKLNIGNKSKDAVRKRFGMSYEKIKDCIYDINGAINFLEKKGYKEFYLIGESTGANKICVYHYFKPKNKVTKYILLSGGDDTGIYYNLLGEKRFYKLLKESKEKIRRRKGEDIILELLPEEIFSYKAFYDTANPDGDYNCFPFLEVIKNLKLSKKKLFRHFKSINKPTHVIYGEKDEYAWGDVPKVVEILKRQKPEFKYEIIKDADHSFSKHQRELSIIMSNWL